MSQSDRNAYKREWRNMRNYERHISAAADNVAKAVRSLSLAERAKADA